jgi:cytochrome c-type biogenesis protein
MMEGPLVVFLSALWLGILTSISPCPLASNIAAVAFISRKITRPRQVLLNGFFYAFGRMIAYTLLGILIVWSALSVPVTANFLQKYMNKALGPLLIITGFFLLEVITLSKAFVWVSESRKKQIADEGYAGAFALGFIFALSFCPISAALFFGSLIPLALRYTFGSGLPLIYGMGTAIPVLVFALAVAAGVSSVPRWSRGLSKAEPVARKITGLIFILVGIYYVRIYLFKGM